MRKEPTVLITCKKCDSEWDMINPLGKIRKRHWLNVSKHYWPDIDWKEKTFTCTRCSNG